jgi:hypothetical protein
LRCLLRKINRWIGKELTPPGMLTDLRRNFEYLVLGSTQVWSFFRAQVPESKSSSRYILFALPTRTVAGDYLVLQRMHSYLRKGGKVIWPIDLSDRYFSIEGIGIAEFPYLHPVTVDALDLKLNAELLKQPVRRAPKFCIIAVAAYLRYHSSRLMGWLSIFLGSKCDVRRAADEISGSQQQLRDAAAFCRERSLDFIPVFILPRSLQESEFKEQVARTLHGIDYKVCRSVSEIRDMVSA